MQTLVLHYVWTSLFRRVIATSGAKNTVAAGILLKAANAGTARAKVY